MEFHAVKNEFYDAYAKNYKLPFFISKILDYQRQLVGLTQIVQKYEVVKNSKGLSKELEPVMLKAFDDLGPLLEKNSQTLETHKANHLSNLIKSIKMCSKHIHEELLNRYISKYHELDLTKVKYIVSESRAHLALTVERIEQNTSFEAVLDVLAQEHKIIKTLLNQLFVLDICKNSFFFQLYTENDELFDDLFLSYMIDLNALATCDSSQQKILKIYNSHELYKKIIQH